jgi:hypothetical protein
MFTRVIHSPAFDYRLAANLDPKYSGMRLVKEIPYQHSPLNDCAEITLVSHYPEKNNWAKNTTASEFIYLPQGRIQIQLVESGSPRTKVVTMEPGDTLFIPKNTLSYYEVLVGSIPLGGILAVKYLSTTSEIVLSENSNSFKCEWIPVLNLDSSVEEVTRYFNGDTKGL